MSLRVMNQGHKSYHFGLDSGHALIVICENKIYSGYVGSIADIEEFSQRVAGFGSDAVAKVIGGRKALEAIVTCLESSGIRVEKKLEIKEELDVYFRQGDGSVRFREKLAKTVVKEKIKVLVVDDSSSIRKVLKRILQEENDIEVVAEAGNPLEVEKLIQKWKPDVITLDIHMPEMSGVELLRKYFPKYKIPTIMVTSIRMEEGPLIIDALEIGAVDYFEKPEFSKIDQLGRDIRERVRAVSDSKSASQLTAEPSRASGFEDTDYELLLFGSSTGGTDVLRYILSNMPTNSPPIFVVQHMPPGFTRAFAERLNSLSDLNVVEASDGQALKVGHAYIAPGGYQSRIVQKQGRLFCSVGAKDDSLSRHSPSVDVLFHSVAELKKPPRSLSTLLTGMGKDGAEGLLMLKTLGQNTAIQSEKSSVVWGMPRAAYELEAHNHIWDAKDIPKKVCREIAKAKAS